MPSRLAHVADTGAHDFDATAEPVDRQRLERDAYRGRDRSRLVYVPVVHRRERNDVDADVGRDLV
jgi:hypothetical protein